VFALAIVVGAPASINAQEVTLAGFAFGGLAAEVSSRFPFAADVIQGLSVESLAGPSAMSRIVVERSRAAQNSSFDLTFDSLASLRDSDQALVAALVLTGETVFTENFSNYHKVYVSLRGDALLFDYQSKTVVKTTPLSAVSFDVTAAAPTAQQIRSHVSRLLRGPEAESLVSQFVHAMSVTTLPAPGMRTFQVRTVDIASAALAQFPPALQSAGLARSLVVDALESSIASATGVPLVPSRVTHATGVMYLRFEDAYDYELTIPAGDYVFDLTLTRLAKAEYASNNVATTYIFGAFVEMELLEPLLEKVFFSSSLINGETAVVPAGRLAANDFPGYEDALRGLFRKFASAIAGANLSWVSEASPEVDIADQIRQTSELIRRSR